MRRILILLLASAFIAPLLAGTTAAGAGVPSAAPTSFPDVPPTHPFAGDIDWMLSENLATGYADGLFRPAATISRQAAAAFLYRFAESPNGDDPTCAAKPFADIESTHPFCGEIAWMAAQGLTTGYADGTFRPTGAVTRQALAAQLYRLSDSPLGPDPTCSAAPFTDIPTSHPFCGEIDWLVDNHIVEGYADDTFRPTNAVSRQAMSAFLHRLHDLAHVDPEPAVDWRFDPAGILLAPGAAGVVHLVGIDANGNDTAAPLPAGVTFASTDASAATFAIGSDNEVTITGAATAAMTLTTATIDGTITDPITVTVAVPVDEASLIGDDAIFFPRDVQASEVGIDATGVGPFTPEEVAARFVKGTATGLDDPASFLGDGSRMGYVLKGAPPAPDTLLIGKGAVPLMGRVVSTPELPSLTRVWAGDAMSYSLISVERVPFTEAFTIIKGGYDDGALEAIGIDSEALINAEFCDPATNGECDGTPTLVEGEPEVEPYNGPTAPGEGEDDVAAILGPPGAVAQRSILPALDGEQEFSVAGLECKVSGSVSVAALKLESIQPNVRVHVGVLVDVDDVSAPDIRMEVGARMHPKVVFSLNLQANITGKIECTAGEGLKFVLPATGPWGLASPGARILPTVEANLEVSPGPSAKATVTAQGEGWVVVGFEFDPSNKSGHMAPGQQFRAITGNTGPTFTLTPEWQASLSDTDSLSLHAQVTAGAFVKLEFGVQLGGPVLEKYLRGIGRGSLADDMWQPFAYLKAGVQGRITYDNDGAVLTAKGTSSFIGAEVLGELGPDTTKLDAIVKALTGGNMAISLAITLPGPKWTIFEPPVMSDLTAKVDGDSKDASAIEVTKGQTLHVEVPVDAAKTMSWTGELTGGSIWETVSATHDKSDVMALSVGGGAKADKKLTGEVVVTQELCDTWKSATTYSLLGYTPLGIDIPTWAGQFSISCVSPNIDWHPEVLTSPGAATLKGKSLPLANRDWEITSSIPSWLDVSPLQGTFGSADASSSVTFGLDDTVEPPDCGKPAKTFSTTVAASAGEVDGEELTDELAINWKLDPKKPNGDDCPPPPKKPGGPGGAGGDPHMRTIDGTNYEGQVFGEYTYLEPRSGDPADGPVIQARHEATNSALVHGSRVTSVTGTAVEIDGHTFEAYARPDLRYFIDGVEWTPTHTAPALITPDFSVTKNGVAVSLAGPNVTVLITRQGGTGTNPSGYFDVTVMALQDGSLEGLLGVPDEDTANDSTRADGVVEPNLSDVAAIRRFTDSYDVSTDEDSLFTSLPLADRPEGDARHADPISDAELAPTLALVQAAINPPVCTTTGAAAAAYQQLTRNLALDAYAMGLPIGDLTGYSCSYYVAGTATLDLGPGQPLLPLTGLEVTVEAPGMAPCTTAAQANGTYACDLRPVDSTTAPPPGGVVATATARWPGDPTVVATGSFTFADLAPFNGSARGSIDLQVDADSIVVANISGTVTRDGVPYVGQVVIDATTNAPASDPSAHFSAIVTTASDGSWTLARALSHSVTSLDLTATVNEGGLSYTANTSASGLHTGQNDVVFDFDITQRRIVVSGVLQNESGPYVGTPEVVVEAKRADGSHIQTFSANAPTNASGAYSASMALPQDATSAVVRTKIYENGWTEEYTTTRTGLLAGLNPTTLDGSYTRVRYDISGTAVKFGVPITGPSSLIVQSSATPKGEFESGDLANSGNNITFDSLGHFSTTVYGPDGTTFVRLSLATDGQYFTEDHSGVGALNTFVLNADASQPIVTIQGAVTKDGAPYSGPVAIDLHAFKANPTPGGDPISFWPAYLGATAVNGQYSVTQALPRQSVKVTVAPSADSTSFAARSHDVVMGPNTLTYDVDLTKVQLAVAGQLTRNGAPFPDAVFITIHGDRLEEDGTWIEMWSAVQSVTADGAGAYSFAKTFPANVGRVRVEGYIDGQQFLIVPAVDNGPNNLTFNLQSVVPVLDLSGTLTNAGGDLPASVGITLFLYGGDPGAPVYLFQAPYRTALVQPDGTYAINDVVLPMATTSIRASASWTPNNGTAGFEKWLTVAAGDNALVFDMAGAVKAVQVTGHVMLNDENYTGPLTVRTTSLWDPDSCGFGADPPPGCYHHSLGDTSEVVDVVDGDYTYNLELDTRTQKLWVWVDFVTDGTFQELLIDPGVNPVIADLDLHAAPIHLGGHVRYDNGDPYGDEVTMWVYPEGDTENPPADPTQVDGFQSFTFTMSEGDGAYSIDTYMPWDTGRVIFEFHPLDLPTSSSTGLDAPNDGVGYELDWTVTRPAMQTTAAITVDGSPVEQGMHFVVTTNLGESRQYFIEPDLDGQYRFYAVYGPGTWSLSVRASYEPGDGTVCYPDDAQEVVLGFNPFTDWTYTGDLDIDTATGCAALG